MKIPIYGSDFETTNDPIDPKVWLWTIYGEDTELYGYNIDTWYATIQTLGKCKIYFHNLSHDASYIVSDLHLDKNVPLKYFTINKRYAQLIMGDVEILDSLNFFNMPLDKVGKSLTLPKLDGGGAIAQMVPPQIEDIIPSWITYAMRDSEIVYKAMSGFINWIGDPELLAMTLSSTAFRIWDRTQGTHHKFKSYRRSFPRLTMDEDDFIRKTYYGGITQVNPQHQNKLITCDGLLVDINSSYPHKMREFPLPYGRPFILKDLKSYTPKKGHIDYMEANITMKIKPNKIPCLFRSKGIYVDQGFHTSYSGKLYLTSIDLETYMDSYEITNLDIIKAFRFRTSTGFFNEYIDRYTNGKLESKKLGHTFEYELNKIMMNALSGKLGQNPNHRKEELMEDGGIVFGDETTSEPYYTALISAVTAYGRRQLIMTGNKIGFNKVAYMDTDSLYTTTKDLNDINLDPYTLGAWDVELEWSRGRFMVAKRYIVEQSDGSLKVRAGGFSRKKMQEQATIENFVEGHNFETLKSNNSGRNHKRYIEVKMKEMKSIILTSTTIDELSESQSDDQGGEPVIDVMDW